MNKNLQVSERSISSAMTRQTADSRRGIKPSTNNRTLVRAEEFMDANLHTAISRTHLANAAGVSIRTLSRAFLGRHGIGPMTFLRQRRLEAAYRHLLRSDAGSINVTDIAVRYGFNHLGKFAMQYKQAFGESPSVTLRRSR